MHPVSLLAGVTALLLLLFFGVLVYQHQLKTETLVISDALQNISCTRADSCSSMGMSHCVKHRFPWRTCLGGARLPSHNLYSRQRTPQKVIAQLHRRQLLPESVTSLPVVRAAL